MFFVGIDSIFTVIPKPQKWYYLLDAQREEDNVAKKLPNSLVVSLKGLALSRIPPCSCDIQAIGPKQTIRLNQSD